MYHTLKISTKSVKRKLRYKALDNDFDPGLDHDLDGLNHDLIDLDGLDHGLGSLPRL